MQKKNMTMDEGYIKNLLYLKNQINNKAIDLAIFDCDGVLADTEKYHIEARNEAIFDVLGVRPSIGDQEMLLRTRGIPNELGIANVLKNDLAFVQLLKGLDEKTFQQKVSAISRQKQIYFVKIINIVGLEATPGLREFLAELKRNNIKIALASANQDAWAVVEALKLENFFSDELIVTGNIIGKKSGLSGKTISNKADMFEEILLRSKVQPGQTMGFEDSPRAIASFQKLGVFAVGVDPEDSGSVFQADIVFNDFTDYFR